MKELIAILIAAISIGSVNGQLVFTANYPLPADAIVTSIAATDDGGMIITGHASGEGLLYRLNELGEVIWSKRYADVGFPSPPPDIPDEHLLQFQDVVAVNDGFVIAGISIDTYYVPDSNAQRMIAKVDLNGEMMWLRHDGSTIWSDRFDRIATLDGSTVIAVGLRSGIGGSRGWLNQIDATSGDWINGKWAYFGSGTSAQGIFSHVAASAGGIVAAGSNMICAFDQDLDTLWRSYIDDLYDLRGLAVHANGTVVAAEPDRIIGFDAAGGMQFVHELVPGSGSVEALTYDGNGIVHLAGLAPDSSIWHAALDAAGDLLWTKRYPVDGIIYDIVDMELLSDGRTALLCLPEQGNGSHVIVDTPDGGAAACSQGTPDMVWSVGSVTGSSPIFIADEGAAFEELYPATMNTYTIRTIDCSGNAFTAAGKVYIDENSNGSFDPDEAVVSNGQVQIQPWGQSVWSGPNGYSIAIGAEGLYDITNTPPPFWGLIEAAEGHLITFTSTDTAFADLDFGYTPLIDTTVVLGSIVQGPMQCDQSTEQFITLQNLGTTEPDVLVTYSYDSLLTFQDSEPSPDSTSAGVIYFSFDQFGLFQQELITMEFIAPDFNSLGDSLSTQLQIFDVTGGASPILLAEYPINTIVTCAFDPNDKIVYPAGEGIHGGIGDDVEWLDYTVRFQNTGNDTATTVVIADQLSPHLDHGSIQILGHSHPLTGTSMSAAGSIEFRFDQIMLPDSATDPLGSQGFIHFRIDLLSDLPTGTAITNDAGIFFDQNPPVVTNTVINTLRDCDVDQPEITVEFMPDGSGGGWLVAGSSEIYAIEGLHHFTWYLDGEEIFTSQWDAALPVTMNGIYTVIVTDPVGCVITADPYPLIGMSVDDLISDRISARPNPFANELLIDLGNTDGAASIELLDVQGRIVRTIGATSQRMIGFDRNGLRSGIYFLRVQRNDGLHVVPVIAE